MLDCPSMVTAPLTETGIASHQKFCSSGLERARLHLQEAQEAYDLKQQQVSYHTHTHTIGLSLL